MSAQPANCAPESDSSSTATAADTGTTASTSGINVDVNANPVADAHVNVATPSVDLGLPSVDANADVLGNVVHASLATPHAFALHSLSVSAPVSADAQASLPGADVHASLPDADVHASLLGTDANVSLGSGDCSDTSAYTADSSSAIAVHADVPDLGITAHIDADPSIALPDTGLLDVGHVLSSDTSHAC